MALWQPRSLLEAEKDHRPTQMPPMGLIVPARLSHRMRTYALSSRTKASTAQR